MTKTKKKKAEKKVEPEQTVSSEATEEEDGYVVEKILKKKKMSNGQIKYLVKIKNTLARFLFVLIFEKIAQKNIRWFE